MMELKAKVTSRQYIKLLYGLTYEKPMMRALIGVAVILLLWIVLYHLHIFDLPKPLIYQYITLGLIVIVQPIVIYTTIIRNYNSSNHLRETLDIKLTDTAIMIRGESFYMEILWIKIFRIVEKRDWFLIYQNNLSAILIPKKHLQDSEINDVRHILRLVKEVPLKLND